MALKAGARPARRGGRDRLTIAALVARTGVPAASIHHYRRLGLLPAPERLAANRFLYDERHVRTLRLIRALRERRRLSLGEIRRILPSLSGLDDDQAFRPEMWDEAVGLHERRGPRAPSVRLLDAGKRAFTRLGFADVRVDDVCRAAKVAKGSFYNHFRSKEDLYFAAVEDTSREVAAEFAQASGTGALSEAQAVEVLARVLTSRLALFLDLMSRALQRRPGHARVAARALAVIGTAVGECLRDGRDRGAEGARVVHRAVERVLGAALAPPPLDATP